MIYASPKQVRLIENLASERQITDAFPHKDRVADLIARKAHGFSSSEASKIITAMFSLPRVGKTLAAPGYYVRNNRVFVVVENKAKTATYAKEMIVRTKNGRKHGTWEYAPGVGQDIAKEGLVPLTVSEAARLGRLHGACMVCGRTLTDPESVERGIGPVCAKKL